MKKGIHPELNKITVTSGTDSFELLCSGVKTNHISLSVSRETHGAWTSSLLNRKADTGASAKVRKTSIYE